jgi:hypothetical protein
MQLLEKNPTRRPASAGEVLQRLDEIEHLPSTAGARNIFRGRRILTIGLGLLASGIAGAILFLSTTPDEALDQTKVPGLATESVDPDRRAAEWILSIGGKLEINGGPWLETPGQVPETPFAVTQISLMLNPSYTDEGFAHCEGLKQLKIIHFDSTKVGDAGLAHLRESTQLAELYFFNADLTDAGLAHLRNMKELKVLGLGGSSRVTDKGLIHLRGLENLTRLYLDGTQVTDESLPWLKRLKHLQTLDLGNLNVSQAGVLQLKDFPALASICLRGTPTTDETLRQFQNLKLTDLNLDGTPITDEALRYLANHPDLAFLYVRNTKLSDAALDKFQEALPNCQVFLEGNISRSKKPLDAP